MLRSHSGTMEPLPGAAEGAIIPAEMKALGDRQSPEAPHWALLPPGLPRLAARVDSLEEQLRLALTELRRLDGNASWMTREAEGALELALQLLVEEWSDASPTPAVVASVA